MSSLRAEPSLQPPSTTRPLSVSEMNMQGILMITVSKQGTAAVVFGELPCSCDGSGTLSPPTYSAVLRLFLCSDFQVCSLLLVSLAGLDQH